MKKNFTILLIAFTMNAFAQVPSNVPTNGLLGWYPFNGNANDLSLNSNNGTVNGATLTSDRFGNSNYAYSFNGVNNYISIGAITLQSFAISSWIYNSSVNPSNLNAIFSNLNSTPYKGIEFRVQPDSTLMLVCGIGSNWSSPTTTFKLSNNNWYHVVVTSDNSTIKIYVNAMQIASYGISGFVNNTQGILFGTRTPSASNGGWYSGKIDDIGIWNRALTQQEVNDLYNTLNPTTSIIENKNDLTLSLYPNPTNDKIYVDFQKNNLVSNYTIEILNTLGQVVFKSSNLVEKNSFDLSNLIKGIYFVRLVDAQLNTVNIKKIILQ